MDIEYLASVLDRFPDPVVVVDADCRVQWANIAAEGFFGHASAESVGMSGLDLVHPDDLALAAVSMTSVQSKEPGAGLPIEVRLLTPTGWRLTEVVGSPVGDPAAPDIVLSIRDLTIRRRWEVANDADAKFRTLVQNAASLTVLTQPDGTVEGASGALTRILGHDPEAVEGRPLAALVDPPDRATLLRVLAGAPQQRPGLAGAAKVELRLRRPDGDPIPFELTFVNLIDDPTVGGLLVSGHSVADRRAVEDELRSTLALLSATLDATTEGILVVDLDSRITMYNRKCAELWKIQPALVDSGDNDAILAAAVTQVADPDEFMEKLQTVLMQPDLDTFDTLHFRDGRVFERYSTPHRVGGVSVGRVWSFRDVTGAKRLEEELAHQAFHDPLTNLANQALFRDRVEHALVRQGRVPSGSAVLFLDLDNFKTVNDSLGHPVGDELLAAVSVRVTACLREADTAARLGGDEFAILLEDLASPDIALDVADRIIAALRQPFTVGGMEVFTSASIGVVFAGVDDHYDRLLRDADLAMYTAKARGKGCVEVFEVAMHAAAVARLETEADLRRAHPDEFVLHYQPVVSLPDRRIVAVEALARWNHPTRGLLGPDHFIPLAEETGLIDDIGRRALEAACRQTKQWQDAFPQYRTLRVNVNLAPHQLGSATLVDDVDRALARSGLAPEYLLLEITEGAVMRDTDVAVARLMELRELGIQLAIDDFGTGYSSLTYLQRFPLDVLKVDRGFVSALDREDAKLVEVVFHLAETLGLRAVAEGVETERQVTLLRRIGCRFAQGYLFSPPVAPDALYRLLAVGLPALTPAAS